MGSGLWKRLCFSNSRGRFRAKARARPILLGAVHLKVGGQLSARPYSASPLPRKGGQISLCGCNRNDGHPWAKPGRRAGMRRWGRGRVLAGGWKGEYAQVGGQLDCALKVGRFMIA